MHDRLLRSFTIQGKAKTTFTNYVRCLSHMDLHFDLSPESLNEEQVQDYLFLCKEQHDTPSDSFFKHKIYGLRAAYKVMNLPERRIGLPQIKRQNNLPCVLNKKEVRQLLTVPKYLRHRLMLGLVLRTRWLWITKL